MKFCSATLSAAALALSASGLAHAAEVPVDLTAWTKKGPSSNGNWVVSPDGFTVTQTINGDPTFFVGPDNFSNTTLRGKLKVTTGSDNDFIGFVMGYQAPLGTGNDMDYVLFDWKQADQSGSREGFALSRVNGTITNYNPGFWQHTNSPGFEVLATNFSTDNGWADNTEYNVEIAYFANRVTIKVGGGSFGAGTTVLDVGGSFPVGRFGFYNYSQASVVYSGFTLEQTPPVPEPGSYALMLLGLAGMGALVRRRLASAAGASPSL